MIAFSEYGETVRSLGRRLAPLGGVAWLTSHGGHTASGAIRRREILAQLAPDSIVPRAEQISLLVTTDVLSEGLDLQRASVVVHLDLPWNPARLEQRLGRVRRLGSPHSRVTVYALAPPASSDRLVRVEQRLREKIRLAERTVGVVGRILPPVFSIDFDPGARSAVEMRSETLRLVSGWQTQSLESSDARSLGPVLTSNEAVVAAVSTRFDGLLAALDDRGQPILVANVGRGITIDETTVLDAVRAADGQPIEVSSGRRDVALRSLAAWWELRRGSAAIDSRAGASVTIRARALQRLASIAAHTPRHERSRVTSQVELARSAVTATLSAGSERVLGALVASHMPDDAWLRALAAFAEAQSPARPVRQPARRESAAPPLIAMILFVSRLSIVP